MPVDQDGEGERLSTLNWKVANVEDNLDRDW